MKFSQLIEYNKKNIFLHKAYIRCVENNIPRLFSKKSKLSHNHGDIISILSPWLYSLFLLYVKLTDIEIVDVKLQTTCFYLT